MDGGTKPLFGSQMKQQNISEACIWVKNSWESVNCEVLEEMWY
jgi:hypothetical protein